MEQTNQYQLSLWDEKDRIMREDFNADNAKTEQALAGLAGSVAELAAVSGNCKIVYGSYTGTGTWGVNGPNVLTFEHKPLLVFIQTTDKIGQAYEDHHLRFMRGSLWAVGHNSDSDYTQYVSWGDKSVQWYSYRNNSPALQFNQSGMVYHYVAFLDLNS